MQSWQSQKSAGKNVKIAMKKSYYSVDLSKSIFYKVDQQWYKSIFDQLK